MQTTENHLVINTGSLEGKTYDDILDQVENSIIDSNSRVSLPVIHEITPGLYSRELFVPKDTVLTTKKHKQTHQYLLVKGSMIIVTGEEVVKVEAPFHGVTTPGTVRLAIALEDSIWTTFHPVDIIKDKQYSKEELEILIPMIEDYLVEERPNHLLNLKDNSI